MGRLSLNLVAGPWWLCLLILLASVGIAIWSYRNTIPRTTPGKRNTLIVLRSLGLAALLFAIFQPILSSTTSEKVTPSLALVLDNSQSMALPERGHALAPGAVTRRDVMLRSVHDVIPQAIICDEKQVSLYTVGDQTRPFPNHTSVDSIQATTGATDLSSIFRTIRDARKTANTEAIVLYTDGAFTAGENPVFPAQDLGVPVYAVGLGDSTEPRDVALTELFTNEVATVGAAQPVDITLHYGGIKPGEHVTVELFEESQKIGEKTIELSRPMGDEAVSFQYTPQSEGTKKLTARLSALSGEATDKNNLRITYVKVLKNKFHVVLFAGAPSSDVGFLRQFFSENPTLSLSTYIQKQGPEFYEGTPTRDKLGQVDLVVLAGFPIASSSEESIALVRELLMRENRSLLFIPSHQLDLGKLAELGDALPIRTNARMASPNEYKAGFAINPANAESPIFHVPAGMSKNTWEGLPPLYKTETHFDARPESQILAWATLQGTTMPEPMLVARSIANARQLALTGYGIWQWKLTAFGREKSYEGKGDTSISALDLFLANSMRWLTTQEENKRVRIEPSRRVYQAGERIDFLGQVYDESMTPVEHAEVSVHITGPQNFRPIDLTLEATGNGRYSVAIPQGLPKGDYEYKGTATSGGKQLGTDDGRFNVGDFNIELAEPRMRSDILRALAERTGGKFYTPETAANLLSDILHSPRFQPKEITNKHDYEVWNSWPLLVLAIVFFGAEWFMRKRLGML